MVDVGSKESLVIKFKDGRCAELCLKLQLESPWYFCIFTESGWFWKWLSRNEVPNNDFLKSVWKSDYPEVHWEILDSCFHSNDLPYQLSYMLFNQISGHEKLFTTLLAQESNENTKFTKTGLKLDGCFLLQYVCRSDCPEKFFITSSVSWKSNCLETCYRIVDSYF